MVKNILKCALAIAIISWLLMQDKIDFLLIKKIFFHPYNFTMAILILILNAIITAYRWKILIEVGLNHKINFLEIVKVNWIGLFFNSILPGKVTGDVIKLFYLKKIEPKCSNSFLITSTLIDRIIGLTGLIIVLGTSTILNYFISPIRSNKINNLLNFNIILLIGSIFFLITLIALPEMHIYLKKIIYKLPMVGKKLSNIIEPLFKIGKNKKTIFTCLIMSIFVQITNILSFWSVSSPFLTTDLSIYKFFTFIPIGLMTISIPITPSGIGLGHLAFDTLFNIYGATGGASFFNLYLLINFITNALGFFPYILNKNKTSQTSEEYQVN